MIAESGSKYDRSGSVHLHLHLPIPIPIPIPILPDPHALHFRMSETWGEVLIYSCISSYSIFHSQ